MSKIGILGGTFDPIHQAHLTLAARAKEQFHLDKVLFIPALIPPHKASHRDITPAPYRYQMVKLVIHGIPGFEISDIELNRPDVSYTVETLRALQKKYHRAQFFLILGADSFVEISKWRESEEILRMAGLLVARRKGYSPAGPGKNIHWINMPEIPVSSSDIREKIMRGEPVEENILPKTVSEFIQHRNLYREKRSCH